MQNREHRPPVDLSELEPEEDQKGAAPKRLRAVPKKGKLSYMSEGGVGGSRLSLSRRREKGEGRRFGGGTVKGISFLSVGLAILISLTACTFIFATKGNANTLLSNQKLLENKVGGVSTIVSNQTERIDNIINNYATKDELGGYARTSTLSAYATTGQLGSYATKTELNTAVSNLSTDSYWLTGTTGNYTFHVDSRPGIYTAKVSLLYSTPYSLNTTSLNETYEAFGGNWTGQDFIPELVSMDRVKSASFYTGSFNVTEIEYVGSVGNFTAPGNYTIAVILLPSLK